MADAKTSPELPPGLDWRAFTPEDSPKTPEDLFADEDFRALRTAELSVGDAAADFELPLHDFSDGTPRETGQTFHLLERAGKRPVALIFGSYT